MVIVYIVIVLWCHFRRLPIYLQLCARDHIFIGQLNYFCSNIFPVTQPQILTIYFDHVPIYQRLKKIVVCKSLNKIFAFKKH